MPRRLPQPCRYPGCPRLDCAEHRELRRPWASAVPIDRGTSHQNRKWREALFARTPLCAHCRAKGRMTVATIRDHILPLAHGGIEDVDNTEALCAGCHAIKTQRDAQRGRRLARAVLWFWSRTAIPSCTCIT